MMESSWLLFLGGIGVLLVSAEFLVKTASAAALRLKLSPLIIGTTVLAVGTSLPELMVSVVAGLKGDAVLAVGNIVGSNITNILLVLPLAVLLSPIRIGTTKTQRNSLILLGLSIGLALSLTYLWNFMAGLLFLAGALAFTWLEYRWGTYGRKHEDKKQITKQTKKTVRCSWVGLGGSLLGVTLGGLFTVMGAERVAADLGISTNVIGLTLVALATSLPEILVSVMSGFNGQAKLALGNILGSNIYNILLIGGVTALVTKSAFHETAGLVWLVVSALLMTIILKLFKGQNFPKIIGLGLIGLYGVYIWGLIT